MSKRAALGLAVPLSLAMLAACSSSNDGGGSGASGGNKEPIKVGILAPLSGPIAETGIQIKSNYDYAISKINAAGGIDGRQITTVVYDDAANPTQDVTGATKLVTQDKVDFILGPSTSDGQLAIMPTLIRAKIFNVANVGSPRLTPEVMKYGFSVLLSAGEQGKAMVDYVVKKGYKRVATFNDSGEQGRGGMAVIHEELKKNNITITGSEQSNLGTTDMTAQVLKLKEGNPEAMILYHTSANDVGYILKAQDQVGLVIPTTGPIGAGISSTVAKVAGEAALTRLVATAYKPFGFCPGQSMDQKTQDFVKGQEAFDPKSFVNMSMSSAASAHDAVWIAKAAVEGSGSTEGDKMTQWLEQNSSSVTEGLINSGVSATAQTHFLFGKDSMVIVQTSKKGPNGSYERADC